MPEPAEDVIVRNLIEALERLREDLDRMELWAAALGRFQAPVPEYRPTDQYMLDPLAGTGAGRSGRPKSALQYGWPYHGGKH